MCSFSDFPSREGRLDSQEARGDQPLTFEEESRRAQEYLRSVVQHIRDQALPEGTEPAFQFRLKF